MNIRILAISILLLTICAGPARAMDVTDMAGRRVTIPDTCTKVFCATPPALYLLYALDSTLAAGLNFPFTEQETTYLRPEFLNLPVLGGWFGQGRTPNLEAVIAARPDFILNWYWSQRNAANDAIEKAAKKLNLPLVYIKLDTLEQYAEAFELLGRMLHREERGQVLATATRRMLAEVRPVVAAIPEGDKISVYYAEGADGLKTECDTSMHAELINLAGGRNVRSCQSMDLFGMEQVSIEEVLQANPQVMLIKEKVFADSIGRNPVWQHVRAVRDGRVLRIPDSPFNWFDRPPSFMRILGLVWLTNALYPDRYPKDMVAETQAFYDLFLNVRLSTAEAERVLGR